MTIASVKIPVEPGQWLDLILEFGLLLILGSMLLLVLCLVISGAERNPGPGRRKASRPRTLSRDGH